MPVGAFPLGAMWGRYTLLLHVSDQNSLDLVEAHLITSSVVELRRPGAGMVRHGRGLFQRATILQISWDAGSPATPPPE
jgi:hypothetical protein